MSKTLRHYNLRFSGFLDLDTTTQVAAIEIEITIEIYN